MPAAADTPTNRLTKLADGRNHHGRRWRHQKLIVQEGKATCAVAVALKFVDGDQWHGHKKMLTPYRRQLNAR
jgi:hypothetical protein